MRCVVLHKYKSKEKLEMLKRIRLRSICFLTAVLFALNFTACAGVDPEIKFESGLVSNNVYVSEFLGIRFSPGPDWYFYSEEEKAQMLGTEYESLSSGEQSAEANEKKRFVTEFIAVERLKKDSALVQVEDMSLTIGGTLYTEEDYIEATKKTVLESDNNYTFSEPEKATFCGGEYLSFDMYLAEADTDLQQRYYVRKIGSYMVSVAITSFSEKGDGIDVIESYFSIIE